MRRVNAETQSMGRRSDAALRCAGIAWVAATVWVLGGADAWRAARPDAAAVWVLLGWPACLTVSLGAAAAVHAVSRAARAVYSRCDRMRKYAALASSGQGQRIRNTPPVAAG